MTVEQATPILSVFEPDFENMSAAQVLAYIERTRRQLDRLGSLPGGDANAVDPAEAATISRLCDELEMSLRTEH